MASEFRYRDPVLGPQHAGHRHQPERRDRRHARGGAARARRRRRWVLAVTNTVGSTISPRERRRVLHARRARGRGRVDQGRDDPDHRDVRRRALPRPAARHPRRRRGARAPARPAGDPRPARRAARPHGAGARAGPRARRRAAGAVPRPPRRLPDRARGRAEAQGAGLRLAPRASRPARSSTARSRWSRRARPSSSSRRGTRCRPSWSTTCRRSGPAGPARSSSRPTATRASRRTPTTSSGIPDTKSLLTPLLTLVPMQVLVGRGRAGPRARRRPAAQPGQVRHGRVAGLRGPAGGEVTAGPRGPGGHSAAVGRARSARATGSRSPRAAGSGRKARRRSTGWRARPARSVPGALRRDRAMQVGGGGRPWRWSWRSPAGWRSWCWCVPGAPCRAPPCVRLAVRLGRTVCRVIVGIGVDVVDVRRLRRAPCSARPRLLARLFTDAERGADRPESLAARFAAKEAVAKALGAPGGLRWRDAEVVSDGSGRPRHRRARRGRGGGAEPGHHDLAPVAVARRRRRDGRRGGRG